MINYQYNRLDYIFTLSLNVSEYVSEYEKTVFLCNICAGMFGLWAFLLL